jgi:flagellar hook-associated protein 1
MGALFETGVSALLASQRALSTTSHNISNVNTPGFSRQRVNFVTRDAQLDEGGFRGKGVQVASVDRLIDRFAVQSLRTATSNEAQSDQMLGYLRELNNLLGDTSSGVSSALTDLFSSFSDLAADPSSNAVRGVVLDNVLGVVDRFRSLDQRLADLEQSVNGGIEAAVTDLNSLAASLATVNAELTRVAALTTGGPPNDLLDQRDELIRQISEYTRVAVVEDPKGAVTVSIGNGLILVSSERAFELETLPNDYDPSRVEVAYVTNGNPAPISDRLTGGQLGGMFEFRREQLQPARNSLGRMAVALSQTLNAQHREGMDANGNLGRDLFTLQPPSIDAAVTNTGVLALAYSGDAASTLTGDEYRLDFDGGNFILTNVSSGGSSVLGPAGGGPYTFDGLVLSVNTAPVTGDSWLIKPTLSAASGLGAASLRATDVAAAAPIRTSVGQFNTGEAGIGLGEVLDAGNPALLNTVELVFDSPTTYRVNGVGPSIAYGDGANIDLNGWRLQISGRPATGDRFIVTPNSSGVGDARNAVLMAGIGTQGILDGGRSSLSEAYGSLVSQSGSRQQQTQIAHTALRTVLDRSIATQQAISGVNLDEEAANLLRFQQAFQAAAQIISTADTVFQTLINATSR